MFQETNIFKQSHLYKCFHSHSSQTFTIYLSIYFLTVRNDCKERLLEEFLQETLFQSFYLKNNNPHLIPRVTCLSFYIENGFIVNPTPMFFSVYLSIPGLLSLTETKIKNYTDNLKKQKQQK